MNPARKTPLHSPRVIKKIRKRRLIILGFLFTICFLLFVFFYFASRSSTVSIKEINVLGTETLDKEKISHFVDKNLLGSFFFLINKRNIFTYPRNQIKQNLLSEFPRIKKVEVSIDSKNLQIDVVERDPAGVWCSKELKCFFFDTEGFLYGESPEFSGSVYSIYKGGESELGELIIGKKFLDIEKLEAVERFKETLSKAGFLVSEISVSSLREVSLLSPNNPTIMIDLTSNLAEQELSLLSILEDENISKKFDIKNTSYVDLRFGKKVFFKDKGEVLVEDEKEETQ